MEERGEEIRKEKILIEFHSFSGADPKHAAAPPPVAQSLAAQPPYNPSVIQRLPQPGGGPPSTMAGPYPGQGECLSERV